MRVIDPNFLDYDGMYLINVLQCEVMIALFVVDVDTYELYGEVGVAVLKDIPVFL